VSPEKRSEVHLGDDLDERAGVGVTSKAWLRRRGRRVSDPTLDTTTAGGMIMSSDPGETSAQAGFVLSEDEGEAFWFLNTVTINKVGGDDTKET
jgi:hypothetical protein